MNEYFENIIRCLVQQSLSKNDSFIWNLDFSQYPNKLYRFRSFKRYDVSSLTDDYIWLSEPEQFADPEDARVNIGADSNPDIAQANDTAMTNAFLDRYWEQFHSFPAMQGFSKSQFFAMASRTSKEDITSAELFSQIRNEAKKNEVILSSEQEKELQILQYRLESIEDSVPEKRAEIINNYRKGLRVCCLTEEHDNRKMWENYSDYYSGFVIEYSKPNVVGNPHPCLNLFPVEYYDTIPTVDLAPLITEIIKDNSMADNEVVVECLVQTFKQVLSKREEYSLEKEWRFVLEKNVENKYAFPFATAVYAGYRIKPYNLSRLRKICKQKGIKLFKQCYSSQTALLSYEEEKI